MTFLHPFLKIFDSSKCDASFMLRCWMKSQIVYLLLWRRVCEDLSASSPFCEHYLRFIKFASISRMQVHAIASIAVQSDKWLLNTCVEWREGFFLLYFILINSFIGSDGMKNLTSITNRFSSPSAKSIHHSRPLFSEEGKYLIVSSINRTFQKESEDRLTVSR